MAEAKKKTLFHLVQPLLTSVNLLYGLNLGNRKPSGCLKRLRSKLQKHFVCLFLLFALCAYYISRFKYNNGIIQGRFIYVINIFCCSFYLLVFNEPEMERLIRRLNKYKIGKMSQKATSRMIKVFLLALTLVAFPLAIMLRQLLSNILYCVVSIEDIPYIHSRGVYLFFAFSFISFHFGLLLFVQLILLIFPVLLSCLCCVLVIYSPSRLDEYIEDIRQAHSPLRRARLLLCLCRAYYRLQPLASMTNRNMATNMSMLKVLTIFLWVVCCFVLVEINIRLLINIPVLQYSIPLFMYLQVAPSANQIQNKVFEAAAEVLMVDDQWQSHDPISRSLLIKMRLNLLKHLVYMEMDKGPFTLLGDSVDPETLFMIFVEANDLRTMLR